MSSLQVARRLFPWTFGLGEFCQKEVIPSALLDPSLGRLANCCVAMGCGASVGANMGDHGGKQKRGERQNFAKIFLLRDLRNLLGVVPFLGA